jgi:hypothetical protein
VENEIGVSVADQGRILALIEKFKGRPIPATALQ